MPFHLHYLRLDLSVTFRLLSKIKKRRIISIQKLTTVKLIKII